LNPPITAMAVNKASSSSSSCSESDAGIAAVRCNCMMSGNSDSYGNRVNII
jgi:hypothetical protein